MATTFDTKEWLKSLGLADDVVADISAKIGANEKAVTAIGEQVMMRSDYSRKQDELRAKEAKLQADFDAKNATWIEETKRYRAENDARFQRATAERTAAENRLNEIRAQIEGLANDYALPQEAIDPILKGRAPDPEAARRAAAEAAERERKAAERDPRYLSVDDFSQNAQAFKRLPIEYNRIAGEYQSLFKLDPYLGDASGVCAMDRILERAERDKVPLRAAFEREFNVAAKREEIRNADVEARIKAAVEAENKRVRSEVAAEGNAAPHRPKNLPGSIALELAGPPKRAEGTPANEPPFRRAGATAHEDRVKAAVGAFEASLEN